MARRPHEFGLQFSSHKRPQFRGVFVVIKRRSVACCHQLADNSECKAGREIHPSSCPCRRCRRSTWRQSSSEVLGRKSLQVAAPAVLNVPRGSTSSGVMVRNRGRVRQWAAAFPDACRTPAQNSVLLEVQNVLANEVMTVRRSNRCARKSSKTQLRYARTNCGQAGADSDGGIETTRKNTSARIGIAKTEVGRVAQRPPPSQKKKIP